MSRLRNICQPLALCMTLALCMALVHAAPVRAVVPTHPVSATQPGLAAADPCQRPGLVRQSLTYRGQGYDWVITDPRQVPITLYWQDGHGLPLGSLAALQRQEQRAGRRLCFGMNAGMYHPDVAPVGLFVVNGVSLRPLNHDLQNWGNFFKQPNGVVALSREGTPVVLAREAYARWASTHPVEWASQSGPMLLIDGQLHPDPVFLPQSKVRATRNGVCARDGQLLWVISQRPVTFHEFAVFFRDHLQCTNALYLDGNVSGLVWKDTAIVRGRVHGPMAGVALPVRERPAQR